MGSVVDHILHQFAMRKIDWESWQFGVNHKGRLMGYAVDRAPVEIVR